MDVEVVAKDFAALCAAGEFEEAGRRWWSPDVRSLECWPGPMAVCEGLEAVQAKSAWWYANNTVHATTVEGPWIHGDQFALRFGLDFTPQDGPRVEAVELALYTVRDGKVVEERFFGAPMG
jgi:hypothetical protein